MTKLTSPPERSVRTIAVGNRTHWAHASVKKMR